MDESKLVIIDASVIIKWFVFEEDQKNALDIRENFLAGRINLGAPMHYLVEVGNLVGRKFSGDAITIVSQIKLMQIEEYHLGLDIAGRAFEIMRKFPKVSFYDAVYHATAIENGGIFVTADYQYYALAKSFKHIRLLKGWSLKDYKA